MKKIMVEGVDITESVQILYDGRISDMDWGSGFLDTGEYIKVIEFAVLMGWEVPGLPTSNLGLWGFLAERFPDHYKIATREELKPTPEGQSLSPGQVNYQNRRVLAKKTANGRWVEAN